MREPERIIVVANRLPVCRVDGEWSRSPGGLVSALTPFLQESNGVWIGWDGVAGETTETFDHGGVAHVALPLDGSEIEEYYLGFSNATIWPLLHESVRTPEYHRAWWSAYARVNERFAEAVVDIAKPNDLIWVHDYHLLLVPGMVRASLPEADIRFFLHVPFPPVELFARLPWRRHILEGLLAADVIGFQTEKNAANFENAAIAFGNATRTNGGLATGSHRTWVVDAPVSIDATDFERIARSADTRNRAARLRGDLGSPSRIILGADRLDYTKGIDVRLRAFESLLGQHPHLAETTRFIQIAVPSRQAIGKYAEMREEIERIAGRINGMYGQRHHMPVHYIYESLTREELVAYYRAADVMAVTPLIDGMNLVAKEYATSRVDEDGVLLLSEFAGAARELTDAVLVNPYDIDGTGDRMWRAIRMERGERRRRMRSMRRTVQANDIQVWTMRALGSTVPAVAV